jgi:hypothetical protein
MTEEESSSEKSAYEKWVEEINKYDSLHKYAKKKKEEDESEDSE